MAINKESNGFTFGFAITMVVIVGTILALLAMGLKPKKNANDRVKKKMDILSAFLNLEEEKISRSNAEKEFDKYVDLKNAIVLDQNGNVKDGVKAFDVDIKKENRDKTLKESDKNYPLFIGKNKEGKLFILYLLLARVYGALFG